MADFLTTKQASEILDVQPVAVIRAIHRDRIKAVKFGTQWMIERDEVLKYKKDRRIKPKPEKSVREQIDEIMNEDETED